MTIFAHTTKGALESSWEPLYGPHGHAAHTAAYSELFTEGLVRDETARKIFAYVGRLLGLIHDMGKALPAFQKYLKDSAEGRKAYSVNHKSAAAKWVREYYGSWGEVFSYALQGHHSGLPDAKCFKEGFFLQEYELPLPQEITDQLEPIRTIPVALGAISPEEKLYSMHLFVRMIHSCLVDADWLATEAFCEPKKAKERKLAGAGYKSIAAMAAELEADLKAKEASSEGHINQLRKEIHNACRAAAAKNTGVFKLNVPTGGGKTLSSLSFALEHARTHGLKRVIYVVPYTSITEQTAADFRRVFGTGSVLEHHSNVSIDGDANEEEMAQHNFAVENWDAPLIVTTNVQFFESLYACKNKACRKLHNIAQSVIIFDEAQSLPTHLLAPCLAAMKCLQRVYGCSLVLCTATQPALENRPNEKFTIGWESSEIQSLIGEELEARLAQEMKRVEIEFIASQTQEELVAHFNAQKSQSALFIVNLTRQAQLLFSLLEEQGDFVSGESLFHLSARMCPAHREKVLSRVKERLLKGLATVLVSTRVVEAGVDISFPLVYRDRCGLDSLAQSAGRCNRHGEAPAGTFGKTFAFEAAEDDFQLPSSFIDLKNGAGAMVDARIINPDLPILSPELVHHYFRLFYAESKKIGWDRAGIMDLITGSSKAFQIWEFPEIAKNFKLIGGGQRAVIIPYGEAANHLREELRRLAEMQLMPTRKHYREAQRYSVNVYEQEFEEMLGSGLIEQVHEDAGIYMLCLPAAYHEHAGLQRKISQEYII